MVEPPGKPWIARIFEIHDGILVTVEQFRLEELRCFVGHPGVCKLCSGMEHTLDEAAEERRGRRAVEAVIVVENTFAHEFARMENLLGCTKCAQIATEATG